MRKKEKHVLAFLQEEQKFCMLESGKEESGFGALEKRYREQVVRMKENTADYRRHNEELLISERKNELQEEIAALEL